MMHDGSGSSSRRRSLNDTLRAFLEDSPESSREPARDQAPTGPVGILPPGAGRYGQSSRDALARQLAAMKEKSYFEILGVAPDADKTTIHAAFLAQAKRWHPNKYALEPVSCRALATDIFLLIKEAHDTLMDPRKGAAYRARRSEGFDAIPPPKG